MLIRYITKGAFRMDFSIQHTLCHLTARGLVDVAITNDYKKLDQFLKVGGWVFDYEDEGGYWYKRVYSAYHKSWGTMLVKKTVIPHN